MWITALKMVRIFVLATSLLSLGTLSIALSSPTGIKTRHAEPFPFEKIQLTNRALVSLSARKNLDLSQFESRKPISAPLKRQSRKCKAYPDSVDWPSELEWHHFNELLDGALIKTVPEASACYAANGSVLNSSQCQVLTDNWGNSSLR
jgi:hypothetical protein